MSVWNDILSQEENFYKVIQAHALQGRGLLEKAAQLIRQSGRVIYSGIGTGLNSCIPATYYLMSQGFPSQYLDATEAAYGLFPGLKDSTLVLNTRSGETAEVVKLARQAREAGIPIITVTNEPGSQAGQLADVCLPTYSRWDDLVVISAYQGMMASELLLAAAVCEKVSSMFDELQNAGASLRGMLAQSIEQRQDLLGLFGPAKPIYLLGRGPSLASAQGGALVIQETSRRDCVPMATGLFRQGPLEVVDESFRAVIFEGQGQTASLSRRLAGELVQNGSHLAWVGPSALPGAYNTKTPDLPDYLLPFFEIIPCQVLAHDLAVQAGIQPGTVRHIQQVITSEIGIPGAQ